MLGSMYPTLIGTRFDESVIARDPSFTQYTFDDNGVYVSFRFIVYSDSSHILSIERNEHERAVSVLSINYGEDVIGSSPENEIADWCEPFDPDDTLWAVVVRNMSSDPLEFCAHSLTSLGSHFFAMPWGTVELENTEKLPRAKRNIIKSTVTLKLSNLITCRILSRNLWLQRSVLKALNVTPRIPPVHNNPTGVILRRRMLEILAGFNATLMNRKIDFSEICMGGLFISVEDIDISAPYSEPSEFRNMNSSVLRGFEEIEINPSPALWITYKQQCNLLQYGLTFINHHRRSVLFERSTSAFNSLIIPSEHKYAVVIRYHKSTEYRSMAPIDWVMVGLNYDEPIQDFARALLSNLTRNRDDVDAKFATVNTKEIVDARDGAHNLCSSSKVIVTVEQIRNRYMVGDLGSRKILIPYYIPRATITIYTSNMAYEVSIPHSLPLFFVLLYIDDIVGTKLKNNYTLFIGTSKKRLMPNRLAYHDNAIHYIDWCRGRCQRGHYHYYAIEHDVESYVEQFGIDIQNAPHTRHIAPIVDKAAIIKRFGY